MSAFADSIGALIAKLGEPVVLSYSTDDEYDPDTGQKTAGEIIELPASGAPSNYNSAEIDGTTVRNGDIKLTLEQTSVTPEVGWLCMLDLKTYRVESVKNVRKSAESVVYILQLRLA